MKTFRHRTQKLGHFHSASAIRHTGQFCPLAVCTGFSVPRDEMREGSPPSIPSLEQHVVSVLCFPAVQDDGVFSGASRMPFPARSLFPPVLETCPVRATCVCVRAGHRRMAGQCPGPHLPCLFVDSHWPIGSGPGGGRGLWCALWNLVLLVHRRKTSYQEDFKNKNPYEKVPVPHLPCLLWPLRTNEEFSEGPERGCWAVGQVSPGPAAAKAKNSQMVTSRFALGSQAWPRLLCPVCLLLV